jgi:hypothetical protein
MAPVRPFTFSQAAMLQSLQRPNQLIDGPNAAARFLSAANNIGAIISASTCNQI